MPGAGEIGPANLLGGVVAHDLTIHPTICGSKNMFQFAAFSFAKTLALLLPVVLLSGCAASEPTPERPPEANAEAQGSLTAEKQDAFGPNPAASPQRVLRRAIHPAKVQVNHDEMTQSLLIQLTFDACKRGGFVYDSNSLEADVDHEKRIVIVTGSVEYTESFSDDEVFCDREQTPVSIVSKGAASQPYIILNRSAWMGRGGNGLSAWVADFRSTERIESEHQNCLSTRTSEMDAISGYWFLHGDPSRTVDLSGNASMLMPSRVMRVWSGSTIPHAIEADAPYTFFFPSFGRVEFRSETCAVVYSPATGEPIDLLMRQSPE